MTASVFSYLAVRMRFDPFGQLREGIDDMVGALGKEKDDEIHHKDDCVSDLNENDKQTTERNEHKSDVEQEINDLNAEEEQLTADEKRLTQDILKKAMERLGEFYNKKAALMQNKQDPVPGA